MSKPPPPSDAIKWGFGIARGGYVRPLEPVAPEIERAAVADWLARNQPTQVAPGFAIGAEPRHTVGFSTRARNRSGF